MQNHFDEEFILVLKNKFRIYDPSKLLYKFVEKPKFINWFPAGLSDADFMNFKDFDQTIADFFNRSPDCFTVLESGSQRVNGYKETSGTCYFEVTAFVKEAPVDIHAVGQLPFDIVHNYYTYELSTPIVTVQNIINTQIRPLVQISKNSLRGEDSLIGANFLSDVFFDLDMEERNGLNLYFSDENYPLKASSWISSYKEGPSWRRFKPSSEGFLLEIRKSIILEFLEKNNLTLFYNVRLKRSIDTDRTENIMKWKYFEKNIEFKI